MNRDITLIAISLSLWGVGSGMYIPFDPIYLEAFGAGPVLIGSVLGLAGLAMVVTQIPSGLLADRFGRRAPILASWIVGTLAATFMAASTSLGAFVVGMVTYKLTSWVRTPLNAYLTAARGEMSVGRVLTLVWGIFNAGWVVGPLLGGWLGENFGLRTIYVAAAIAFGLSTLIVIFIRPQPVEPDRQPGDYRKLLRNRQFLGFLVVIFVAMLVAFLPQPLAPNFLQNQRDLSLTEIGQLLALSGVGVFVLNMLIGQLPARVGFLLSQLAMTGFALILWQATGTVWYAISFFLLGGYRVGRSLAIAQTAPLVSAKTMGLAYGLAETAVVGGNFIAPLLAGWIYAWNPEAVFGISTFAILAGLILSALFLPGRGGRENK